VWRRSWLVVPTQGAASNVGEYALENVVETVRAATESLAETKKLPLKIDVARSLPLGLGDEQRLTQVLLNLVLEPSSRRPIPQQHID
jgi:signal transduction histidine kinase